MRVRVGGVEFINAAVPVAFGGRYVLVEPGVGQEPLISVLLDDHAGGFVREIVRNHPEENPVSDVSMTPPGVISVADKKTGRFLYKVRPASETSIIFATPKGEEVPIRLSDRELRVRDQVFMSGDNVRVEFHGGTGVGVLVRDDGATEMGAALPTGIRDYLRHLQVARDVAERDKAAHRENVIKVLQKELGRRAISEDMIEATLRELPAASAPTTDGRAVLFNYSIAAQRARGNRFK